MKNGAPQMSAVFGSQGRRETHELAVPIRHEFENRVIAPAGDEHLAHLPAQIRRQIHIGVGDRFVLTHQTAQLLRDPLESALQHGILQLAMIVQRRGHWPAPALTSDRH